MAAARKITVFLSPEMADFVRRSVDAGEYVSVSEAIRDAVSE
ncbi:MAG: ribbon-helix-helix domain-containing protein [Azospirillaceae bacterium]|nr:ribbon-helix-helix domain-containing protein [Azospirillaceae bacterium]